MTKTKGKKSGSPFEIRKRPDGVAIVRFDDPNDILNKLSTSILTHFVAVMDELDKDESVKAIVWISAKESCFIAGADIEEFKTLSTKEAAENYSRTAQKAFERLEKSPKLTVAAINGACLGGGLEFSLACKYRIATDAKGTFLGAPEVKLGLLPAGGGTQRLPRIVGLQAALDMMLTGKNIYAVKAKKIGLVHEVVAPWSFEDIAAEASLRVLKNGLPPRKPRPIPARLMEDVGAARNYALKQAKDMVLRQTKGNYPAPLSIIESVRAGFEKDGDEGYAEEARLFADLTVSAESRELVNLFFGMTSKKKHPLAGNAKSMDKVAVLGAGLMGAGIALVTSQNARTPVILKDVTPEMLAQGGKYIFRALDSQVRKGAVGAIERDKVLSRIDSVLDDRRLRNADIVIEAVFEDLTLKQKVLAEIESAARKDCVFASNTSALPIGEIARNSKRPENVLGMHYFSPVEKMPLLEIVRTDRTSPEALSAAVALGVKQGKTVIVVEDGPGFYTTRILAPYLNETCLLLEEGAEIAALDNALMSFGFPVGPVVLFDEIGIGVAAHVSKFLGKVSAEKHEGLRISDGITKMSEAGYQGKKNKKGFYLYDVQKGGARFPFFPVPKKSKVPDETVYSFFGQGPRKTFSEEFLQERLAFVMINEAAACLEEGVIRSPQDGDLGAVLGLGFPPFRGGPFRYVDAVGAKTIVEKMNRIADGYGPQFLPSKILLDRAKTGRKFYET